MGCVHFKRFKPPDGFRPAGKTRAPTGSYTKKSYLVATNLISRLPPPMPKRIFILCVEDEPEVLDAVVKDLSAFEEMFPVETARSVTEARSLVASIQEEKNALGLVLCDHIMPGENGVEFLIELYRDPFTATARKILLTGQAGLEATVRAVNFAKLDFYIGKPWTKDELVNAVREQMKAYITAQKIEVQPYARLFGERALAEAMMNKFPGAH
jgi:CheY-like chemotaxis protein